MASTEIASELDEELRVCKEALQDQAQEMLSILLQFEARLKNRLDLAEARIVALKSSDGHQKPVNGSGMSTPRAERRTG